MVKQNNIDKRFRYERKFVISELNVPLVEHSIKHHPAIFSKIFYERNINNIYFDSLDLGNYQDNLAGSSEKMKIRIRWYGKTFGKIENPVLEVKIRKEDLGRKRSFKLKSFILDETFSREFLQKKVFEMSRLPKWIVEKLKLSRPTLLNTYKRRYYSSSDRNYRITLDKNMKFYKIHGQNNTFNEKIVDKDNQILELKYAQEGDQKASEITNHFPLRLAANSKYVCGVDLLDLY